MLVLALAIVALLLLPAVAEAKITCEDTRRAAEDVPLRGLPDAPVEDRLYRLTAVQRPDRGVNPTPHLFAQYCGRPAWRDSTAAGDGSFRRRGRGVYARAVRFPHPGPWALAYMDRWGVHQPLGVRHIRPAGEAKPAGLAFLALTPAVWIFDL